MAAKPKTELVNPDQLDKSLEVAQSALVARLRSIVSIETDPECDYAASVISDGKSWIARAEKWFEPMVSAAHAAHKALTTKRGDTVNTVKPDCARVQGLVDKHLTAKKRRLEAIALEEAANERKRIAQERAEQIERLSQQGHHDEAAEVLDAAREEIGAITPDKVTASGVAAVLENMSAAESCEIEITDGALLPRQFLMPDERAILAFARANKNATIPGVRISWVVKSRIGRS